MKNAHQPVSPVIMSHNENGYDGFKSGLTKRELFAAMAMQGLLSNPHYIAKLEQNMKDHVITDMNNMCVRESIDMADELLKQLEL